MDYFFVDALFWGYVMFADTQGLFVGNIWFELVTSLIIGGITAILAGSRGRGRGVWFCIGAFFGPLGLLALFLMPRVRQGEEKKPGEGEDESSIEESTKQSEERPPRISSTGAGPVTGVAVEGTRSPVSEEGRESFCPLSEENIKVSNWYYVDRGTKAAKGPLGISELNELWKRGSLQERSWVWSKHLKSWSRIREIDLLRRYLHGELNSDCDPMTYRDLKET